MQPPRRTPDDDVPTSAGGDESREKPSLAEQVGRLRAGGYARREVGRLLGMDEESVLAAEVVRRTCRH